MEGSEKRQISEHGVGAVNFDEQSWYAIRDQLYDLLRSFQYNAGRSGAGGPCGKPASSPPAPSHIRQLILSSAALEHDSKTQDLYHKIIRKYKYRSHGLQPQRQPVGRPREPTRTEPAEPQPLPSVPRPASQPLRPTTTPEPIRSTSPSRAVRTVPASTPGHLTVEPRAKPNSISQSIHAVTIP